MAKSVLDEGLWGKKWLRIARKSFLAYLSVHENGVQLSNHRCICMWSSTEQCPVHPETKPAFRTMHPTPTPGERVPWAQPEDIPALDANWENALCETEAARKARHNL